MPKGNGTLSFAQFTRPDGEPMYVKSTEVLKFTPVPTSGPLMGPLTAGTRLYFNNQEHQDVKELADEVARRLAAA